jgi:hypothetical protein
VGAGSIWVPPSARTYSDDVEAVLADSPPEARRLAAELEDMGVSFATAETVGSALHPDAGLILLPQEWGRVTTEDGRKLMAAFVKSEVLERMILDATVEYETAGVVDRMPDNPMLQALLCPALFFRLRSFSTFTPLEYPGQPYPGDWRQDVLPGFALAITQDDRTDERVLYMATPPLNPSPGLILPARERTVGRNDRCPCGSGIKFKRCCGA